jgi:glycosyltransferase involved in cell wall biosynthesis
LTWVPGAIGGVAEILRNLDVFVLPSLAEGISNTILEAMASGVPVVATRVGGNPELVEDGITGTLTASQDVDGMARALVAYAADRALAKRHGSAGRRLVEQRFSLDVMVEGYLETYDRVLKRHGKYSALEPAVGGSALESCPPEKSIEYGGMN